MGRGSANKIFSSAVTDTVLDIDPDKAAGIIHAFVLSNTTAASAVAYVQFFKDKASDVTLGTTTPDFVVHLQGDSGVALAIPDGWRVGGQGLSVAVTDTRTGSTAANADINIIYE